MFALGLPDMQQTTIQPGELYHLLSFNFISGKTLLVSNDELLCVLSHKKFGRLGFEEINKQKMIGALKCFFQALYVDFGGCKILEDL